MNKNKQSLKVKNFRSVKSLKTYINNIAKKEDKLHPYKFRTTYKNCLIMVDLYKALKNNDINIHLECTMNDNFNMGVFFEVMFNALLSTTSENIKKKTQGETDTIFLGLPYEIKTSTSKGRASYSKGQNLEHVIFITDDGIYKIDNGIFTTDTTQTHIKTVHFDEKTITLLDFKKIRNGATIKESLLYKLL